MMEITGSKKTMTSPSPYILRAFFDWIVDNGCTPHLLVDATKPAVQIPREFVKEGKIVLNVAPKAVRDLVMNNVVVEFNAKFGSEARFVRVPVTAVEAIYAEETGSGTYLSDFHHIGGDTPNQPPKKRGKPNLTVVKD